MNVMACIGSSDQASIQERAFAGAGGIPHLCQGTHGVYEPTGGSAGLPSVYGKVWLRSLQSLPVLSVHIGIRKHHPVLHPPDATCKLQWPAEGGPGNISGREC